MTYAQIDKLIALVFFIAVAFALWSFFPFKQEWQEKRRLKAEAKRQKQEAEKVVQEAVYHPVFTEQTEVAVPPLVVQHLSEKATLLMRHRRKKQACTAHLIVWSGAKRKVIQDSYYDMGYIPSASLTEEIIEEFVAQAKQHLADLAEAGKRKRQEARAAIKVVESAPVEEAPALVGPVESVTPVEPVVTMDDSPPEMTKLLKFPSVFRGIIEEIGMMPMSKGDREFMTFGVRYLDFSGAPSSVYGANLRDALRQANAGVGDTVEIIKIGRKTVQKGKAPMNLFTIAKIDPAQLAGMQQPSQQMV